VKIAWAPQASDDLESLYFFVAEDDPAAARSLVLRIIESVEHRLSDHPQIGRAGRVPGTRELVISGTPYIVPCRLKARTLQILRVYHGARKWPRELWKSGGNRSAQRPSYL
jgi:toxin ParE1/3/4